MKKIHWRARREQLSLTKTTLAHVADADLDSVVIQPNAAVDFPSTLPPAGFAAAYMWVNLPPERYRRVFLM